MAFPEIAPVTTAIGVANRALSNRYLGQEMNQSYDDKRNYLSQ
jgi:hypothetical protein